MVEEPGRGQGDDRCWEKWRRTLSTLSSIITSILQSREMRLKEVKNLAKDAQWQSVAPTHVRVSPSLERQGGAMWRWWQEALHSGQAGGR